ncbi:hypothetical protein K4A83_05460 [Spirulina subsalsa FACHB-351]|uniref:Uncharacterized protein n=1 Tax=Spirulina subsalsa FACHB-351 TaxID=234711 RepID=A0ABT3L2I6_9CYAN|nr:hypothetical protein [Spirulina subsalsa]MCW6035720.1 hypothetical protein [Spirulina subsalsa FACHB-351]
MAKKQLSGEMQIPLNKQQKDFLPSKGEKLLCLRQAYANAPTPIKSTTQFLN